MVAAVIRAIIHHSSLISMTVSPAVTSLCLFWLKVLLAGLIENMPYDIPLFASLHLQVPPSSPAALPGSTFAVHNSGLNGFCSTSPSFLLQGPGLA